MYVDVCVEFTDIVLGIRDKFEYDTYSYSDLGIWKTSYLSIPVVSQYTYSCSCAGIRIAEIPRYRAQNSAGILGIVSILDWYRPNTADQ